MRLLYHISCALGTMCSEVSEIPSVRSATSFLPGLTMTLMVGYDSNLMAILIDSFMNGARGPYHFRHRRCGHLVSDTSIEELHAFAAGLGMRREWFQCRSIPHYDLTGERYDLALAMGAELVSSRE